MDADERRALRAWESIRDAVTDAERRDPEPYAITVRLSLSEARSLTLRYAQLAEESPDA